MRLLVFVGAGCPELAQYRTVYELLAAEAFRFGYSGVDSSIRWHGQALDAVSCAESINLNSAIEVGLAKIREFENSGIEYDLLGRSFGSLVVACCVAGRWPSNCRKVILWGPPVYWKMWEKFVRDFQDSREYNLTKGVRIGESYFDTLVPIESVLSDIEGPIRIATGSLDTYCPPNFLEYLSSIRQEGLTARVVQGACHEVTFYNHPKVIRDYLQALFGE